MAMSAVVSPSSTVYSTFRAPISTLQISAVAGAAPSLATVWLGVSISTLQISAVFGAPLRSATVAVGVVVASAVTADRAGVMLSIGVNAVPMRLTITRLLPSTEAGESSASRLALIFSLS